VLIIFSLNVHALRSGCEERGNGCPATEPAQHFISAIVVVIGVNENVLAADRKAMGNPFRQVQCFIARHREDSEFALRLDMSKGFERLALRILPAILW
jgi:hypothetical protein